jgi:hypothetical protein
MTLIHLFSEDSRLIMIDELLTSRRLLRLSTFVAIRSSAVLLRVISNGFIIVSI